MNSLFLWLVPPLVGGLIGYVTNSVAIKMLFRPLEEWRLFGIRIPFTPGILPRQRHKLAYNIGRMVERELLTPEILRQRLRSLPVEAGVKDSIVRYTENLLKSPLEKYIVRNWGASGGEDLFSIITRDFINSPVFDSLIDACTDVVFGPAVNNPSQGSSLTSLREMLGEEQTELLREKLERFVAGQFEIDTDRLIESFISTAGKVYPQLIEQFIRFLKKEEIHEELEIHGRVFLSNAILKLNVFQRFFISAGQYDKTLHDRMPEIVDDLIRQLEELFRDENVRRRFLAIIREGMKNFFTAAQTPPRIARFIAAKVMAQADKPLLPFLRSCFVRDAARPGLVFAGFLRKILLVPPETRTGTAFIAALTDKFLEKYPGISLGDFLCVNEEKKKKLDTFLRDKILFVADKQIEEVLKAVNISAMVSDRVDSLDMIKVERIVLDVMANQFQWINAFGGLLGALIGLFQAAFSWFTQGG
jgi:uncharacterized membrane-anchored protein YjiN (DUF445 family)